MSVTSARTRLSLFQLPLDPVTLDEAAAQLSAWMYSPLPTPHTVVTLNPELIVQAQTQPEFAAAIQAADLVTADGIGIVYAAQQLCQVRVPRAPGFDLCQRLMQRHGSELRVFFLGGKPGVAEQAALKAERDFEIQVAGVHHGYFSAEEDQRIAQLIAASRPHLLLTGMGGGRQEVFNQRWREVHAVPVAIGCGGVLDVLAGTAQLAPDWTRQAGVEWLWRVAGDRQRWGRAPRLARFVQLVQLEKIKKGKR